MLTRVSKGIFALGLIISSSAYAADMAVKAPPPVVPVAPVANWTGFYVGGVVGGATFDPSCNTTVAGGPLINAGAVLPCGNPLLEEAGAIKPTASSTSSLSSSSFVGGGKVGYDWEFWSHAVVGVVGELDWTNLNATTQSTAGGRANSVGTANENIDWLASARGRLGWAFDNILFYATGGVAWTKIKDSASFTVPPQSEINWSAQGSSNKTGVVAGGGFEYRVTQNVSVVAELLWYGFGSTGVSASIAIPRVTFATQFTNNDLLVGTLGVNYRF